MKQKLVHYLKNKYNAEDLRLIKEENIIIAHFKSNNKSVIHEYKTSEDQFELYYEVEDTWYQLSNGRTTTSGPTQITNNSSAEKAVKGLVSNVLIKNKFNMIDKYISQNKYNQHNYEVQVDGLKAIKYFKEKDPSVLLYEKNEIIIIEGDFGYSRSWLNWKKENGTSMKTIFHDIFRTEENLITEHWDIMIREKV